MRIRERTEIARPAARVWPYVVRPELFAKWHPKIHAMDARGEFRIGTPFTTHYLWNNTPLQCTSIVSALEPERVLELTHTNPMGRGINPAMRITERFTLEPARGGTVVTNTVDIENAEIPWFLRPLIWFVTRFGRPTAPNPLKMLCESEP